jgi:hypothetical protein
MYLCVNLIPFYSFFGRKIKDNLMEKGQILEGGKNGVTLEVIFVDSFGITLKEVYNTKQSFYITFEQLETILNTK